MAHVGCGLRIPGDAENSPMGRAALLWDTGSEWQGLSGAQSSVGSGQGSPSFESNPVPQTRA